MITKYTSYDEIRAVLGVEDDELLDSVMDHPVYLTNLLEDFADVHPRLEETFDLVDLEFTPTPIQTRFLRVMKSFAVYSIALQLTTSLPMFAPRSIGDGKATTARFLEPYKDTIEKIEKQFTLNRDRLKQIMDEIVSELRVRQVRPFLVGVGLNYDPVTGD